MKGYLISFIIAVCTVLVSSYAVEYFANYTPQLSKSNFSESDYTILDIKLKSRGNINFSGYKTEPCSNYLRTNSDEISFNKEYDRYIGFFNKPDNLPTVAYYVDNTLFVSNYIMKYASKSNLKTYIIQCDNELYMKEKSNSASINRNLQSWNQ
jgi:hypothetical protein